MAKLFVTTECWFPVVSMDTDKKEMCEVSYFSSGIVRISIF